MTFHDDELDNFLLEKLELIRPTAPRDPEIAKQRRNEYLKQVMYPRYGGLVFPFARLMRRKPWQISFNRRPSLVPTVAAILLIIGVVFGSWGTVYAAQESLPNDLLYTLKLTGENLQLAFTSDTAAKISLLTTFADRRVDEAAALALQGKSIPEELALRMDEQYDVLFTLTASMDEASQREALNSIQNHLHEQDQVMRNAINGLPEDQDPKLLRLREMLRERQQLVQMELGESNTLQQQFRHQLGKPTAEITGTLTTTLTTTPEITITLTITPGQYGPGPCETPGTCIPGGYTYGPGPMKGTPPVSEDHEGYGPGPEEGPGPQQPPTNDDNQKQKDNGSPHNGQDGSGKQDDGDSQKDSSKQDDGGSHKGKP